MIKDGRNNRIERRKVVYDSALRRADDRARMSWIPFDDSAKPEMTKNMETKLPP